MSKTLSALVSFPARLWARLYQFLNAHAEREVNAWASSLQYKRRYTNPEAAKAFRQAR